MLVSTQKACGEDMYLKNIKSQCLIAVTLVNALVVAHPQVIVVIPYYRYFSDYCIQRKIANQTRLRMPTRALSVLKLRHKPMFAVLPLNLNFARLSLFVSDADLPNLRLLRRESLLTLILLSRYQKDL